MMKKITIIVAMAKNRVIGKHNALPWDMPADMARFKALTLNKPIVMGRKTYESIGKTLKDRQNIVITQHTDYPAPGCQLFTTFEDALKKIDAEEIMIIGGGSIYTQALPLANTLHLTYIHTNIEDGDTFFPEINIDEWDEVSREDHQADDDNPYDYTFLTLKRRKLPKESAVNS